MKKILLLLSLSVVATVAWAQRESLQRWAVERGAQPPESSLPSIVVPSLQTTTTANAVVATTELSAMLAAFDRILGLNEEQKEHVSYENEKALERIISTNRRTEVDETWKQQEIQRLKQFRDKRIVVVLTPKQIEQWERFKQGKEGINSLRKVNEMKTPYERGEKKFYPESEYGEFTSLEQIKKIIADHQNTITASGFEANEIEQLYTTIYNFN